MGGNNSKENLALLTAREHFICHLLLIKITDHANKQKMCFALGFMLSKNKNQHRDYKITSKIYEIIKMAKSKSMKELWKDPEFKKSQSDKIKKYWSISANRDAASKKAKIVWENDDLRLLTSLRCKVMWDNPDKRAAQSALQKQIHVDNPAIGKKKANIGKNNGMYGKTHTEEVKQKLSALRKEELTGKTYEELYGKEKAIQLKDDRSKKLKTYLSNNPGIRAGSLNARAEKSTIISPDGTTYHIHGTLKEFCEIHDLSYASMRLTLNTNKVTNGKNKGWIIYK